MMNPPNDSVFVSPVTNNGIHLLAGMVGSTVWYSKARLCWQQALRQCSLGTPG
jgi:hypothetical protein